MSEVPSNGFEFRIEVPFGPRWHHVELLRTSILHCVATLFQDHDFCEQLGMVTAELVQNAIDYGHWGPEHGRPFRLLVRGIDGSVTVEVVNPIDPTKTDAKRLKMIADRLANAANPRDAYIARLREIVEKPDESSESGLGLLRVAYETSSKFDVHIDDGLVRVRATIPAQPIDTGT